MALFVAGLGIIVRGAAYALRSGTSDPREIGRIDAASAVSSVLTPFALGAAVGGLATGRVPFGNAKGDLITSWLNPTSIFIGALAVAFCAYLAAVYLAADAARRGDADLAAAFRARALGAGAVGRRRSRSPGSSSCTTTPTGSTTSSSPATACPR